MLSFYTFMTALFTSLLMVPFLRRWALERGQLDQPDARKQHTVPMPRLGGVAVAGSFAIGLVILGVIPWSASFFRGLLKGQERALLGMALGSGAEIRQAMALVSIGGVGVSSVLILIACPVLYHWIEEIKGRLGLGGRLQT